MAIFTGTNSNDKVIPSFISNGVIINPIDSTLIGADIIYGLAGDDLLDGGHGNDSLYGEDGNDTLSGSFNNNFLDGGNGIDTVDYSILNAEATINLTTGKGIQSGFDTLINIENAIGSMWNDNIKGSELNNVLRGNLGNDILEGLGGDDLLDGGDGNDSYNFDVDQPLGNDIIQDTSGIDALDFSLTETKSISINLGLSTVQTVVQNALSLSLPLETIIENAIGGKLNDVLLGNSLNNDLSSGTGNDLINGLTGNDSLDGGIGDDFLIGDLGDDRLLGNEGNDTLKSGAGNDYLYGDWLSSLGSGQDILYGGDGNDILYGGRGDDTLYGEAGNDTLDGDYNAVSGNDILDGGDGDDSLNGYEGNDTLYGGNGDDSLTGYYGNDFLQGGSGNDTLSGGGNVDYYVFNTGVPFKSSDIGIDTITDFPGAYSMDKGKEKIVLDKATFTRLNSPKGGALNANEFAVVTSDLAAETSTALMVYNTTNGYLFYNENGNSIGFGTGTQFAILGSPFIFTHPLLYNTDFLIRDDNSLTSTLAITTTNATQVEENSGTKAFTFTVNRSSIIGNNSINWVVTGTGINPTNATDFGETLPSGIVSFIEGENSKIITINITGDTIIEPDENFTVTLSNPTNGATVTTAIAIGTITNDDAANYRDKLTTSIVRFQNTDKPGTYLFAGEEEAASIRKNNKNFKEEGLAFQVAVSKDDPLMQPFYRFRNTEKGREGTYLFAGEQEATSIRSKFKNFVEEGLAFYTYSAGVSGGTTDFARFQNKGLPGTYLFTGPSETSSVMNLVLAHCVFSEIAPTSSIDRRREQEIT